MEFSTIGINSYKIRIENKWKHKKEKLLRPYASIHVGLVKLFQNFSEIDIILSFVIRCESDNGSDK